MHCHLRRVRRVLIILPATKYTGQKCPGQRRGWNAKPRSQCLALDPPGPVSWMISFGFSWLRRGDPDMFGRSDLFAPSPAATMWIASRSRQCAARLRMPSL